jgi:uncharacterized membrane protein
MFAYLFAHLLGCLGELFRHLFWILIALFPVFLPINDLNIVIVLALMLMFWILICEMYVRPSHDSIVLVFIAIAIISC